MPHLVGLEGLVAGAMFALSTPFVTIGSDAESDIALIDRAVSPLHARLTMESTGQVRVEAGSPASVVLVNNARVSQAILAPGDLLQIGDNVFRFEA